MHNGAMTEPTDADVEAMATHPLIEVWQAGVGSTGRDFKGNEAMVVRYALNVMRRVHGAVRAQVVSELEAPGSTLCDCEPNENPPTNPRTGARMDHHCECRSVLAVAALSLYSTTRHAEQCGHGTEFDELYGCSPLDAP